MPLPINAPSVRLAKPHPVALVDDSHVVGVSRRKWAIGWPRVLTSSTAGADRASAITNERFMGELVHGRPNLKRVVTASLLSLLAVLSGAQSADAQSFRLDNFRSAERPDDAFGV